MTKQFAGKPLGLVLIMGILASWAFGLSDRAMPEGRAEAHHVRAKSILFAVSIATSAIATGGGFLLAHRLTVNRKISRPSRLFEESPEDETSAGVGSSKIGLRVLVIESNPVSREVLFRLLDRLGCSAEAVDAGKPAIRAREQGDYDLILMERRTLGLDGRATTHEIRRVEVERGLPRIPIVAMSSNASDANLLLAVDDGIDGHVVKPVTLANLLASLSMWARPVLEPPTPAPAVFDMDSLVVRCFEDRQFAIELIEVFLRSAEGSIESLGRAMDAEDGVLLKAEAHGLAGSALAITADALAGHCRELEACAGLDELLRARMILTKVVLDWELLRPILEARLGEIS